MRTTVFNVCLVLLLLGVLVLQVHAVRVSRTLRTIEITNQQVESELTRFVQVAQSAMLKKEADRMAVLESENSELRQFNSQLKSQISELQSQIGATGLVVETT